MQSDIEKVDGLNDELLVMSGDKSQELISVLFPTYLPTYIPTTHPTYLSITCLERSGTRVFWPEIP